MCDCDYPVHYEFSNPKARKAHTCVECQREIPAGSEYIYYKALDKYEGWFSSKTCLDCDALSTWTRTIDDCCWEIGTLHFYLCVELEAPIHHKDKLDTYVVNGKTRFKLKPWVAMVLELKRARRNNKYQEDRLGKIMPEIEQLVETRGESGSWRIAEGLTKVVQTKAPGYYVEWHSWMKLFPDDEPGVFEVYGSDKKVHYRRRTRSEVLELIK